MAGSPEPLILKSIKAPLGLPADYTPFDAEILMHINTSVSALRQLGVRPEPGVLVTEETEWDELLGEDFLHELENVKSYIYLNTRLVFDVASMGPHTISALERQRDQIEWRIMHTANPPEQYLRHPVVVVEED